MQSLLEHKLLNSYKDEMISKKIHTLLLFVLVTSSIFFSESCSSSKEPSKGITNKNFVQELKIDSSGTPYFTISRMGRMGHPSKPQKDFTAHLSFFRILSTDSLKLKAFYFSNKDSLIQLIKTPEIAVRAGISGYIAIEFALDSSGTASNFKILTGLGAGIEESIIEAMSKFKFNTKQKFKTEKIYVLLTGYIETHYEIILKGTY